MRHGLNRDLGFSADDRTENIRRIAEVSRLLNEAGVIVVASFISPYRQDREAAREVIGAERFVEVYVDTPLEVCEERDPKGLYRKARGGRSSSSPAFPTPSRRRPRPPCTWRLPSKTWRPAWTRWWLSCIGPGCWGELTEPVHLRNHNRWTNGGNQSRLIL